MIWKQVLLGVIGFAGGISVAGGVFAFISILEMLPRLASKLHMANRVYHLENCIFWGGLTGAVLTVFEISVPFGSAMLAVFGLFTGIFVGCLVMSLAETLKALPVIGRRLYLAVGLQYLILSIALGKLAGSLAYFFCGMAAE